MDSITREEFIEAFNKLEDKYMSRATFQTLLDFITKSLLDQMRLQNLEERNELNIKFTELFAIVNDLKTQKVQEGINDKATQDVISDIRLLLRELATDVKNYKDYTETIFNKLEEQEDITNNDNFRIERLEDKYNNLAKTTIGISSKGENPTLLDRIIESEITTKDHEHRIMALEKLSPKNFELVRQIKENNDLVSIYNILILLIAKVIFSIKYFKNWFLEFFNRKRKEIFDAIAQSLIVKILLAIIGLLGTSPIWLKVIEKFVDLMFK